MKLLTPEYQCQFCRETWSGSRDGQVSCPGCGAMMHDGGVVRLSGRIGRPVSTGSDSTKPVQFRVTAAQRAELEDEAKRLGLSSADLAAKRRAFPKS